MLICKENKGFHRVILKRQPTSESIVDDVLSGPRDPNALEIGLLEAALAKSTGNVTPPVAVHPKTWSRKKIVGSSKDFSWCLLQVGKKYLEFYLEKNNFRVQCYKPH